MPELDIYEEDLTPEQRDIYDCIGSQAYEKLVQRYGGLSIYIAKADSVIRSARDEKIRRDFNGYNFKFLVNKYNLSDRRWTLESECAGTEGECEWTRIE